MFAEDEFARWLRRPEKSFQENMQFALKAWQAVEFQVPNKYEMVLAWAIEEVAKLRSKKDFPADEFSELLSLRAQPGLISQETKQRFVEELIKMPEHWAEQQTKSRMIPEFLLKLNDFELLQDLFRSNYDVHTRLYGTLLQRYVKYLQQFRITEKELEEEFPTSSESNFFQSVINSLKTFAKRAGERAEFEKAYTANTLHPLVQVLLEFRTHSVCFFNEFLEVERLLCDELDEKLLISRVLSQPLHVCLLTLECGIVSRRGVELFLKALLRCIFQDFISENIEETSELVLYVVAYTLEMFRKHDISLLLEIEPNKSALEFLGEQLFPVLQACKDTQLTIVLMVLCAALRLNPLILEKHIFQLTIWMIVAKKDDDPEKLNLFEKYLELLMDMFRRLSRTEKFIGNLLKLLKEWLQKYELPTSLVQMKRKSRDSSGQSSTVKKRKLSESSPIKDSQPKSFNTFYLELLFKEFYEHTSSIGSETMESTNFPQLQYAWPSNSVGVSFSKLITGLVSKPSLVVCKTLLFSLRETLQTLQEQPEPTDSMLFLLDFHAALLCEYFDGCKLTEQFDKFPKEIFQQHQFTIEVLAIFGQFVLSREHNRRIMSSFLQVSYYVANFQLLLMYYRPDNLDELPVFLTKPLHSFLTSEEWALIQQRVYNFGKSDCKFLLNRLLLQRMYAKFLLESDSTTLELSLQKTLLSSSFENVDELELILSERNSKWLIANLRREEKMEIAKEFCFNTKSLATLSDDLEMLLFMCLAIYEQLIGTFIKNGDATLLGLLNCDFDALRGKVDFSEIEKQIQLLSDAINTNADARVCVKLPSKSVEEAISALNELPMGYLHQQQKTIIFLLHLAFYRDLKCAGMEEFALIIFGMLTDLLHFGQTVPITKYLTTQLMLSFLPVTSCSEFYEMLFVNLKNGGKDACDYLSSLFAVLKEAQSSGNFNGDHCRLTLIAIESLSSLKGQASKRMHSYLNKILEVYADYVNGYFDKNHDRKSKKDKKFVQSTLAGFAPYMNSVLGKLSKANVNAAEEQQLNTNENFRWISKIYLGHSMDYNDPHAIHLLQVALTNRKQLHLDQDEIEFLLSNLWRQLNADLKMQKQLNVKSTEAIVKIIIGNKTNEDILLTLKDIRSTVHENKKLANVTRLLALIAKCQFSTIKGAIFNEQFKHITYDISLRLAKDERQQYVDYEDVLSLLACQQAIVNNKMIPISMDTMDSMLSFMMGINIKKYEISDSNGSIFHDLHLAMSELCLALIKHRHLLLMDRMPQFMHIFKDLLQAVVWYKCDRHKNTDLKPSELDDVAKLASKLEALMHIIASHVIAVKRIAPYVLTFAISLMVTNARPTTLYPKVKTHIESICLGLVGVCDHHIKGFIMRCSNEAGRQVYELLVKDYQKYHKFKGKV